MLDLRSAGRATGCSRQRRKRNRILLFVPSRKTMLVAEHVLLVYNPLVFSHHRCETEGGPHHNTPHFTTQHQIPAESNAFFANTDGLGDARLDRSRGFLQPNKHTRTRTHNADPCPSAKLLSGEPSSRGPNAHQEKRYYYVFFARYIRLLMYFHWSTG